MQTNEDRQKAASDILDRHLSTGATDPVNVDSHARQAAQDGIANLSPEMFAAAQKQIYNLMKFDSFSRFLKSDMYKESLVAEMAGKKIPYSEDPEKEVEETKRQQKKDKEQQHVQSEETGRRRSLLPWNNFRSKSKERHNQKLTNQVNNANNKDLSHNSDCEDHTLARVILPDKATTVVFVEPTLD